MACGINPQGYHAINRGSFQPKYSFRVRQQMAAARREGGDREDFHGSRRLPTFSLPEIKVKRLMDKTEIKKHLRSHTFDSASRNKLRLPPIPLGDITAAQSKDLSHRSDKRVVKNGHPWWEWKQGERPPGSQRHLMHTDGSGVAPFSKQKAAAAKHGRHNLRQKLPLLVGYRDDSGNLVFSEMWDDGINPKDLRPIYNYPDKHSRGSRHLLNRRYYYSQSRDGIQPLLPTAKVTMSQACLYDLGGMQQCDPEFDSYREGMLNAMHEELHAMPSNNGFVGSHLGTLTSRMGEKLKQSLNSERARQKKAPRMSEFLEEEIQSSDTSHAKEKKVQPVVTMSIDVPQNQEKPKTFPRPQVVNTSKALAILNELIDILNNTHYAQAGTAEHKHNPANRASQVPTILSHIDLADFFQKPESAVRQYDHFKKLSNSTTNSNYLESQSKTSGESSEEEEVKDQDPRGLTQLLAVQRLQSINDTLFAKDSSRDPAVLSKTTIQEKCGDDVMGKGVDQATDSCSVEHQVMCIDLNDQYKQFSNGKLKTMKRTPTSRKLVHSLSKLLTMEPVERQDNPRPDLEVSGEKMKHLYKLGLLERDEELKGIAEEGQFIVVINR